MEVLIMYFSIGAGRVAAGRRFITSVVWMALLPLTRRPVDIRRLGDFHSIHFMAALPAAMFPKAAARLCFLVAPVSRWCWALGNRRPLKFGGTNALRMFCV